jgi:hypothetical protein
MADSENSRTLPTNKRANLHLDPKVTGPFALALNELQRDNDYEIGSNSDLWRRWRLARNRQQILCFRQQRLEKRMLKLTGGFPQVAIYVQSAVDSIVAQTEYDIERLLPGDELAFDRENAISAFRKAQAIWNAADTELGYSAACTAESEWSERTLDIADKLSRSDARSIQDVAAKLHCLIDMGEPGPDIMEAPWPQLRLMLAELLRLCG